MFTKHTALSISHRLNCTESAMTICINNAIIHLPHGIYMLNVNNGNIRARYESMLKVNNKDTRMTPMMSFWCLCYWLWTYFTTFCSVSVVKLWTCNNRLGLCNKIFRKHSIDSRTILKTSLSLQIDYISKHLTCNRFLTKKMWTKQVFVYSADLVKPMRNNHF